MSTRWYRALSARAPAARTGSNGGNLDPLAHSPDFTANAGGERREQRRARPSMTYGGTRDGMPAGGARARHCWNLTSSRLANRTVRLELEAFGAHSNA